MKPIIIALLCSLAGCGQQADAAPLRPGNGSVRTRVWIYTDQDRAAARAAFRTAKKQMKSQTVVRMKMQQLTELQTECSRPYSVCEFFDGKPFDCWRNVLPRHARGFNLVITGPLVDNGQTYFAGMSFVCHVRDGLSVVHGKEQAKTDLATEHENGHQHCAKHDDWSPYGSGMNIMNSNAGQWWDRWLIYSDKSVEQINAGMSGMRMRSVVRDGTVFGE